MVKVKDKGEESLSPSSMETDGSFVVLERSTIQDFSSSQFPNGDQMQAPTSSLGSDGLSNPPQDSSAPSFVTGSLLDLSPEEIQRKLQEVVQENVELKETLHQNNLAMKQQFNTLVMWQDEVFKVHQSHKEKFQETKELIMKLKAENSELKSYLEKCGSSSDAQLKGENAKLKGHIAELQQKLSAPMPRRDIPHSGPTKKEEELTDLVKQLNTQLETAERARRQLTIEVESLTARRIRAEREAAELKTTLADQIQKCSNLEKRNAELEQKMAQCEQDASSSFVVVGKQEENISQTTEVKILKNDLQLAQTLINDLKKQVDNEKDIKSQLITQMQRQEQVLLELQKKSEQQASQQRVQPLTPDEKEIVGERFSNLLRCCEERLKELNVILFRQTERYTNLDKLLRSTAINVHLCQPLHTSDTQNVLSLRTEIEQLMKLLAQEQAYSGETRKHLGENEKLYHELFEDYRRLVSEWETNQEPKNYDRHSADYQSLQARGFSEKLDHLVAQVLCKDEELKENEKEIKELKEKVRKLELESEAVAILKAQVEVYQSDFNAEREARENLAGEKERLAEDLRLLQARNQELIDELETYQQNHFDSMQSRNLGGSNWSTIASPGRTAATERNQQRRTPEVKPSPPRVFDEEVPPPKEYVCPMCKMAFRQLGHLEYHVETCLDS